MKRHIVAISIILTISVVSPLVFLSILFALNSFNPLVMVFITEFEVLNESNQVLKVIPIGTFNSKEKAILPLYVRAEPAIPRLSEIPYTISPSNKKVILYDCDDINFTELAVSDSTGTWRQLTVDPNPPSKDYYTPKQKLFAISKFSDLEPITESVRCIVEKRKGCAAYLGRIYRRSLIILGAPVLFACIVFYAVYNIKQRKRAE